jgi:hypothetical protein
MIVLASGRERQNLSVKGWFSVPRKKEKIYPRNCFACETQMTLAQDCRTTLECRECDIQENGTMNGRFHIPLDDYIWDGETIAFIDHGEVYLPSPDIVMPIAHPAGEGLSATPGL